MTSTTTITGTPVVTAPVTVPASHVDPTNLCQEQKAQMALDGLAALKALGY